MKNRNKKYLFKKTIKSVVTEKEIKEYESRRMSRFFMELNRLEKILKIKN